MKVAIRVDASAAIGTGHAKRMAALAAAFDKAGLEVVVVQRDLEIDLRPYFADVSARVLRLPEPVGVAALPVPLAHAQWAGVSQKLDAAQTIEQLVDIRPDWVVVDHYSFDAEWHDSIREHLGSRIAVIDDLADRGLSGDVIIDHNFHPDHDSKYDQANLRRCPVLAGPRYAMIAAVYASALRYSFDERVRSIGIFMGGVDAISASEMALDAICAAGLDMPVEVVSTSANPNLAALHHRLSGRPGYRLSVDLPDLAAFYARHDLQIGAGGGALWERFCIGAPTLAAICAANQRESVPYLAALGVLDMVDATGERQNVIATMASALRALADGVEARRNLHLRGMELVDGRGTERIVRHLIHQGQEAT